MTSNVLKNAYDEWAVNYDDEATKNIAIVKDHPIILDLIAREDFKNVGLDLGCGTGILSIKASEFAKEITGVDINASMLKEAKRKKSLGAELKFIEADASKPLPFQDEIFDFVISALTLHHIRDIDPVYSEIWRVLKPGGVFVFDEFYTGAMTEEQEENKLNSKLVPGYLRKYRDQGADIWHWRPLKEQLKNLESLKFKVEDVVETFVDEEIEELSENYHIHEGRIFSNIIKVRKLDD